MDYLIADLEKIAIECIEKGLYQDALDIIQVIIEESK